MNRKDDAWRAYVMQQMFWQAAILSFTSLYPGSFFSNLGAKYSDAALMAQAGVDMCRRAIVTLLCVKKSTRSLSRLDRNVVRMIAKLVWATRDEVRWQGVWVLEDLRAKTKAFEKEQRLKLTAAGKTHKEQHKQQQRRTKQQLKYK